MIGGNKLPFRLPCGGATPAFVFGARPISATPAPVPAFGNTTQMQDHCGNTIPVDKRFYQTNTCGVDICAPNCNDCPGGTNLDTNTPEPPKISENTWSAAIGSVQLQPLEKIGGKWVQAFKFWHGAPGWLDCDGTANDKYRTVTYDVHSRYEETTGEHFSHDADKTGARSASRTTGVITAPTFITTETDKFDFGSGLVTTSFTNGGAGYTADSSGTHLTDFDHGGTTLLDALDNDLRCAYPVVTAEAPGRGDLASFIAAWNAGNVDFPSPYTGSLLPDLTDPNNYTGSATGTTNGGDTSWSADLSFSRTATTVTWDCTFTQTNGVTSGGTPHTNTSHYYGTVTLSDVYTINDVLADAAENAAQYLLTDDAKYPFRTDAHTTVAPWIIRNEHPIPVTPIGFNTYTVDDLSAPINDASGNTPFSPDWSPTWAQRAWFDPTAYDWKYTPPANSTEAAANVLTLIYDGAFIGAPLAAGFGQPVGGNPRGVFDKDHENFFRRNCIDTVGWTQANESRGAFTPLYLPSNATKWTDDLQATSLYPCPFISADGSGVYLQKWNEIQLPRPSLNVARPFGPDKFALDESNVFYVSDFTAGVVTLQTVDFTTPTSLPFTLADIVGSAAVGGFFAVTAVGTDTVTLGPKVYDLPAGWETPSHDGLFCFGRLKYPNAPGMDFIDATPEVGGRVAVTVADGVSVRTFTTATVQTYLSLGTTPEKVDILDANMIALAANVDLTRVDATHFTVTTAFATIATAKWIVPHLLNDGVTSGQKYKFADNRSKGDYVLRTWTIRVSDKAVIATTQTDACLPKSPCGPPVVGFTPNGETSASGHYWPMPTTINNGEVWLGQIQFWMPDPFWQQPHKPVDVGDPDFDRGVDQVIWSEDNGTCQTDFQDIGAGGENVYHKFYPMRPFVEARCTLPTVDGDPAPALASGVDLTAVATPPPQASIGDVEGPLVEAIQVPTPTWITMLTQRGCVDAAGVFATDYEANGTTPTP